MQRSISRVFLDLLPIQNFAYVHCVTLKTMTIKMDLLTFFAKRFKQRNSLSFPEIQRIMTQQTSYFALIERIVNPPGRHILENYTGNTRVFGVVVVYFLRKYTVYFPCNSRVPTEITRITREIATPQWRNDGEITLNC